MIHVFIVNPIVCDNEYSQKLRNTLSKIPRLIYYVLTTKEAGNEAELVELICHFFDSETIRFYACGGSGTLRNIINAVPDLSQVEFAMVPFGTCDFLKVFDYGYERYREVSDLIRGEVVYVDYIKTNVGIALNSVSFGLDSDVGYVSNVLRNIGLGQGRFTYNLSTIYAALFSNTKVYDLEFRDEKHNCCKVTELFLGNGNVMGGNMKLGLDRDVQDGLASYCVLENKVALNKISAFKTVTAGDIEETKKIAITGHTDTLKVRRDNGSLFYVNLDGELANTHELRAEMVRQGIKFVLPRGGAQ